MLVFIFSENFFTLIDIRYKNHGWNSHGFPRLYILKNINVIFQKFTS